MAWLDNWWVLIFWFLLFDIYITHFIPWNWWKFSDNKAVKKVMGCQSRLLDFNRQLQRLIVDFLDLPIEVITVEVTDALAAECVDLRGRMGGKQADALPIADVPYPQLWAARHGFQPGLSILDLLMNEGREAIFTLQKMLVRGG